jgi:hypothetical protein
MSLFSYNIPQLTVGNLMNNSRITMSIFLAGELVTEIKLCFGQSKITGCKKIQRPIKENLLQYPREVNRAYCIIEPGSYSGRIISEKDEERALCTTYLVSG